MFFRTLSKLSLISLSLISVSVLAYDNPLGSTVTSNVDINTNNENVTNAGTISTGASGNSIDITFNTGITLTNSGLISSGVGGNGVNIVFGGATSITNTGIITVGASGYGINNGFLATITTLTNSGTISAGIGGYGINNGAASSITTLINSQGVGNDAGALTYTGILPTNYKISINGFSNYGQLSVNSISGSMAFSIATGSIVNANGKYENVLQGFSTLGSVSSTTGLYGGYAYSLVTDGSIANAWDLCFGLCNVISNGPAAADTQASLNTQARRLRSTFNSTMASGNFANMNTYDCNLFDKNNMCISAGGRYTNIDNPSSNNSAAVVVLGYKVSSNIRIGGFLDQSINNNTPTGIQVSNKNPMMGAFAVWNKNADGLGYQVKIANAYQDKDVRSTRDAFGETGEAGTGKTNLNTQSYVGELSYAFNYQDSTIVRPYFAVRYTNIKQDGYTEDTTASVTAPLTYAKLSDRSTTALMGVKLNHALTPRTNLTASLGVEQDINHKTDQLTASGVADLTSENFNNNIKRTRPVASAGAYYAVAKNQRLSGEVYYQQLPFQSTGSATAYVNYMIGF
jgi:hypothetical protein